MRPSHKAWAAEPMQRVLATWPGLHMCVCAVNIALLMSAHGWLKLLQGLASPVPCVLADKLPTLAHFHACALLAAQVLAD